MRRLALALLLVWPALAPAQDLPALHDVTGVAADDVLNIRSGPGTAHPAISAFGPFMEGIEVTARSEDGRWLRVNMGEGAGWVSARFMQLTGPDWTAGLPARFACFGTEPFWAMHVNEGVGLWRQPDIGTRRTEEEFRGRVMNNVREYAARYRGGDIPVTMLIRHETCSDGMSDSLFGLAVTVIRDDGGPFIASGCCTIAP